MMQAKKTISLLTFACLGAGLLCGVALASCKVPQPLLDQGPASFAALYTADRGSYRDGFFIFNAPSNRDYIAINSDFSQLDDVLVGIDLSDFMQAGLDPQSMQPADFKSAFAVYDLPTSSMVLSCRIADTAFQHGNYQDAQSKPLTGPTPVSLYSEILRTNPDRLDYDYAGKYFSLSFGDGLALEWPMIPAGTPQAVSFVLDPTPFVKAGLKVDQLKKWKVGTLEKKAADGSSISLPRLRLSFNLP